MASIQKYTTLKGVTRYRVMWRDSGKQVSVTKDRWKDANDLKIKVEHDMRNGIYVSPNNMSVAEYLTEWIQIHRQTLAYRTAQGYEGIINKRLIPHIGKIQLQKLNAGHIELAYKSLLGELSNRSVRYTHTVLNMALKAAVRKRYITYNPCIEIATPKKKKVIEAKTLQPEEVSNYMNLFKDTWAYPAIVLATICGMRRGEILALRWKDINFKDNKININGSVYIKGSERVRKSTKNGKARDIYITNSISLILKQYKKTQKENKLLIGEKYFDTNYVIREDNGKTPRPDYLSKFFTRLIKQHNLPAIRFHDLRHTTGSLMLYEGADLQTVSDTLGHHSAAFTAKVYTHTIEEGKKKSAKSMEKYLSNG